MDSFFGELIKLGAAGLVIYVIASPLIKYLIDRSKAQDEYIRQLVSEHFKNDSERHAKIIAGLERVNQNLEKMPETILARAQKFYPPSQSQQPVTVNVSQPATSPAK